MTNRWDRPLIAAALCCAMGLGSALGLSAVRDALMINWPNFGQVYSLVRMATALLAVVAGLLVSRLLTRFRPASFLRIAFLCSGLALLMISLVAARDGKTAAVLLWVHTALFSLVLSTMFWGMVSERYGPRGTRAVAGKITGGLAVGSLLSVVVTYLLRSSNYLLPLFALEHILCAVLTGFFAVAATGSKQPSVAPPGIFETLRKQPYTRVLAALLFFASISAFLLSFGMQLQVKAWAVGRESGQVTSLYAGLNLAFWIVAFLAQTFLTTVSLNRLGPAGSTAVMHAGVLTASFGAMALPGLAAICIARGTEICFRNSLFRSGYEMLFSPVPPERRGTVKSAIDVCSDSLGDFAGAALLTVIPILQYAEAFRWNVSAVVATTTLGLMAALWARRSYAMELGRGMVQRVPSESQEQSATLWIGAGGDLHTAATVVNGRSKTIAGLDAAQLAAAISQVRHAGGAQPGEAWAFLEDAAKRHPGQLLDILLDPETDSFTRRTIAKALGTSPSPLIPDGLVLALKTSSFAVRRAAGRALRDWCERHPGSPPVRERVIDAVVAEIESSRTLWEHEPPLRPSGAGEADGAGVLHVRARSGLRHVFTLLALILPAESLRTAAASLESGDEYLRGIALEYLECVLPERVRDALWPFLEAERPKVVRSKDEILADITRISPTIHRRVSEIENTEDSEWNASGYADR